MTAPKLREVVERVRVDNPNFDMVVSVDDDGSERVMFFYTHPEPQGPRDVSVFEAPKGFAKFIRDWEAISSQETQTA